MYYNSVIQMQDTGCRINGNDDIYNMLDLIDHQYVLNSFIQNYIE